MSDSNADEAIRQIAEKFKLPGITAKILHQRGFCTEEGVRAFLYPQLSMLPAPDSMKDMAKATHLLAGACKAGKMIFIHGDYDVDGVTATALLAAFFREINVKTAWYIPDRQKEKYGLSESSIDHLLEGYDLRGGEVLVSVDCGISSVDEVEYAQNKGLAVIVTDHHEPLQRLPDADALINPKQPDCSFPFKELAGVGVAFCLVIALRKAFAEAGIIPSGASLNLKKYLDLVALGTVADVVPLRHVNRIFVKAGLEVLSARKRLGVAALCEQCGLHPNVPVGADDIGYKLAPRINAAGRLKTAMISVELLLAQNRNDAQRASATLEQLNAERKMMEAEFCPLLRSACEEQRSQGKSIFLVLLNECHQGILGILASRMVDLFDRPVIVFTKAGQGDEIFLKGSGRSIDNVNLHRAIGAVSRHVLHFGGHPMAAGLALHPEKFNAFAEQINAEVERMRQGKERQSARVIDHRCVDPRELTRSVIDSLQLLQPCGEGNPEPVFLMRGERLLNVWKKNNHLRFNVQLGEQIYPGIGFNLAESMPDDEAEQVEFGFSFKKTWYKGQESSQLHALFISSN